MSEATRDLLIEIGTEELPPLALRRLSEAFTGGIRAGLDEAEITCGEVHSYATPRRLAVLIHEVAEKQPSKEVERRGPALAAAFDDQGCPTKAAEGFARSCGVSVDDLETAETDKGAWLMHRGVRKGVPTTDLLSDIVKTALDRLPIPKRMRWGALRAEFVRPVHWVVLLFGDEVVDTEILSVRAGRETRGHRFHHPEPLYLGEPAAYAPLLETEGRVIADLDDRREAIRAQVLEMAAKLDGEVVLDEALLDEVTGLVEWPVALAGEFDARFLDVPTEALVSAMKGHQKYFPVVDAEGRLKPYFITVSNIESRDPTVVRAGNERVIRPRLSDAEFFWNQDRRTPLHDRVETLRSVVFQKKLGTLYDKSRRVARLAAAIAPVAAADERLVEEAATVAKCDLMTEMVGEFPELQGIMGRYYARSDGLDDEVAAAIDEQYMPRFAGDRLPATPTGQTLAVAERIDTIMGIFAIGQPPSGTKDPFALRRAALGVLRILIEKRLDLDLVETLRRAESILAAADEVTAKIDDGVADSVFEFMLERLRAYYLDAGVRYDTFDAVAARRPSHPLDFDLRVKAVDAFRNLPEAESLAAANKRILNILRKAGDDVGAAFDAALLQVRQEKDLASAVDALESEVEPLLERRAYEEGLLVLAGLRDPVDAFFDHVMVMADDEAVRRNRLALLNRVAELFLRTADVSKLQS